MENFISEIVKINAEFNNAKLRLDSIFSNLINPKEISRIYLKEKIKDEVKVDILIKTLKEEELKLSIRNSCFNSPSSEQIENNEIKLKLVLIKLILQKLETIKEKETNFKKCEFFSEEDFSKTAKQIKDFLNSKKTIIKKVPIENQKSLNVNTNNYNNNINDNIYFDHTNNLFKSTVNKYENVKEDKKVNESTNLHVNNPPKEEFKYAKNSNLLSSKHIPINSLNYSNKLNKKIADFDQSKNIKFCISKKFANTNKNQDNRDEKNKSINNDNELKLKETINNDLHDETINLINIYINNENFKTPQNIFSKRLHLKNSSNGKKICKFSFRRDCINKRIKTYFNNYMLDKLNFLVKNEDGINFVKLPKELIINLRADLNKDILEKTLENLYSRYVNDPTETIKIEYNKKMISLSKKLNLPALNDFLSTKVQTIYEQYIKSDSFKNTLKVIERNDGKEYVDFFKENAVQFTANFIK